MRLAPRWTSSASLLRSRPWTSWDALQSRSQTWLTTPATRPRAPSSSACRAAVRTGTSSPRKRWRTAPSRSWSSGRSSSRCRSSSSRTRAGRWASPRTSSSSGPTEELELAGVTGTNGKTTTAFLLYSILAAAGRRPGLLGTIESRVGGERRPALRTTPEAIDLQRSFREMLDAGDRSCAHGGDLARLRARPARPRALLGARLHEPDAGSPRLPRHDRALLRRQAAALHRRAPAGGGERWRPVRAAARGGAASGTTASSPSASPTTRSFVPRGSTSARAERASPPAGSSSRRGFAVASTSRTCSARSRLRACSGSRTRRSPAA